MRQLHMWRVPPLAPTLAHCAPESRGMNYEQIPAARYAERCTFPKVVFIQHPSEPPCGYRACTRSELRILNTAEITTAVCCIRKDGHELPCGPCGREGCFLHCPHLAES
ncbi:hypothetical protein FKP32DRAFT_1215178 [Trametes sanguinea]|nr:hypothetical protein FKP32DRAFT_1215178 [Trametes sanguinea]